MAREKVVQGQTDPINQQLLDNGVPIDLTGITVDLELFDNTDTPVNMTGSSVTVVDAVLGKVRFTAATTTYDASKGPYKARWKLTSGSQVAFVPSDVADNWLVRYP